MKSFKLHYVLIISALLAFSTFTAAQQEECPLQIGINLGGPTDYGSEWPFVDIYKYSRDWTTYNHNSYSGNHPWDTEFRDLVPRDENGYPLEVPFSLADADTLQLVKTVWANTSELISGTYIFLYEGTGVITWWGDATLVSETPGRMVVEVTAGPESRADIIVMSILESQQGDHLRNMRFLLPGTEDTYQTNPWATSWIDKLEPFNTLRFMDWGQTNNSLHVEWENRSHIDESTYTIKGVPYERWIDICNLKGADAWVCIPHLADDNYMRQMAIMFRDNLDPKLKIHVEYSNELWNFIFHQTHYGLNDLDQSLEWPERVGPKVADAMRIWTEVFDGQLDRLSRILGVQNGYFDIGNRIFQQIRDEGDGDLIDVISPSGYMYYDVETIRNLGANATGADVIEAARRYSFTPGSELMQGWRENAALAEQYGKGLSFYEAGEHFTPDPWGEVVSFTPALRESHTDPGMYDLYIELFDTLANLTSSQELMMHFAFISPHPDMDGNEQRYGNFGALHSQFHQSAPYTGSPKYQSMLDYKCIDTYNDELSDYNIEVFPNPAHDYVTINIGDDSFDGKALLIYDILGKLMIAKGIEGQDQITIKTSSFHKGMYELKFINKNGKSYVQKLLIE